MVTDDLDDVVSSLHRIEVILETIAVDVEDLSAELAWRSLPFYYRWWRSLIPGKTDMVLDGPESNANGPDPQP